MNEKLISLNNLNTFKSNLIESTNGSIDVTNEEGKKIDIGIKISEEEGNAIEVKDDGIYSGSADGLVECDPVPYPVYREKKIYKTPYGEYKLFTGKGELYYESWELGDVRYANGTTFPNTTLAEEIARWRNEVVGSYINAVSGGDDKILLKIETVADTGQLYYGTTNIGILVQGGPNVIYNGAGNIYSNVVFGPKKMAAVYAKEVQLATKDDLMDIDIDTSNLVKKENLTDKSITSLKVKLEDGGDVTIGANAIGANAIDINSPSDFIIGGKYPDMYIKGNTVNLESNGGSINIETKSSDDIVLNSNNEVIIGTTGSPINIGNGSEALYMKGCGATLDVDSDINITPDSDHKVKVVSDEIEIQSRRPYGNNSLKLYAANREGESSNLINSDDDINISVGSNTGVSLESSYFSVTSGDGADAQGNLWIDGDGWLCSICNEYFYVNIVQDEHTNNPKRTFSARWDYDDVQKTSVEGDIVNIKAPIINLNGVVKRPWTLVHNTNNPNSTAREGKYYTFDISSVINNYSEMAIYLTDDDSDNPYILVYQVLDLELIKDYMKHSDDEGWITLYRRYSFDTSKNSLFENSISLKFRMDGVLGKCELYCQNTSFYEDGQIFKVFMR